MMLQRIKDLGKKVFIDRRLPTTPTFFPSLGGHTPGIEDNPVIQDNHLVSSSE
jgi:hypothetical protein